MLPTKFEPSSMGNIRVLYCRIKRSVSSYVTQAQIITQRILTFPINSNACKAVELQLIYLTVVVFCS
jgi:hypothetical protein